MRLQTFNALLGETITAIEGGAKGDEEIVFTLATGERYKLYHSQDCCESVDVEDVAGDMQDVIGSSVVLAEESTNEEGTDILWTFYRLATIKGTVVIRWRGNSDYYSVDVSWKDV